MSKTKRQLQKEQTRNLLLETALELFGRNGIIVTKTADIAKAANVSHGTLFSHFSTQEELITAVIEEFDSRITFRLHELASNKCSIREILKAHIDGIREYELFYTRLVIEGRLLPKVARETFVIIQSSISFHLSKAAEEEMKKGNIISMPMHLLFNTWVSLIHYYIANSDIFSNGESIMEAYGEELINHFIKLISFKKE